MKSNNSKAKYYKKWLTKGKAALSFRKKHSGSRNILAKDMKRIKKTGDLPDMPESNLYSRITNLLVESRNKRKK